MLFRSLTFLCQESLMELASSNRVSRQMHQLDQRKIVMQQGLEGHVLMVFSSKNNIKFSFCALSKGGAPQAPHEIPPPFTFHRWIGGQTPKGTINIKRGMDVLEILEKKALLNCSKPLKNIKSFRSKYILCKM